MSRRPALPEISADEENPGDFVMVGQGGSGVVSIGSSVSSSGGNLYPSLPSDEEGQGLLLHLVDSAKTGEFNVCVMCLNCGVELGSNLVMILCRRTRCPRTVSFITVWLTSTNSTSVTRS